MGGGPRAFWYDTLRGVAGLLGLVAATAAIYAHLRLGALETLSGEFLLLFGEDAESQRRTLENLRIAGAVSTLAAVGGAYVLEDRYLSLVDDPAWEVRKGFGGAVLIFPLGVYTYVFLDRTTMQSVGISLMVLAAVYIVIYAVHGIKVARAETVTP